MFTLKNTEKIKIFIVMLVLSLIVFAVPATAKRARTETASSAITNSNRSRDDSSRQRPQTRVGSRENVKSETRQARATMTRSPTTNRNRTETVATARADRRVFSTRPSGQNNFARSSKSESMRENRTDSNRFTNRSPEPARASLQPSTRPSRTDRNRSQLSGMSSFRQRDNSREVSRNATGMRDRVRENQSQRHEFARRNPGRPFQIYRPERHRRIYDRVIWPRYRHIVYYNRGPHFTFRYTYPYYHRKYVFVSLGGYWPLGYSYVRYFWYGYHPYYWYGYDPAPYVVEGDTYNYYTYNYGDQTETTQTPRGIRPVDENTFADVREKLAAQAAEKPAEQTLADVYFEDAVKAFESGNYDTAAEKFSDAMDQSPEDVVLPFAYVQALFANQDYYKASAVLKKALANLTPDKEGVFYPRGLYADDNVLFEQIGHLAGKVDAYKSDAELQLLLGYQLLGAGKLDEAIEPLQQACQNPDNSDAANKLLNLLEKIKTDTNNSNSENTGN